MKNNTIEATTTDNTVTSLLGKKAIPAFVYRSTSEIFDDMDCTNGGISSKENELLILSEEGYIEITKDNLHKVVLMRHSPAVVPAVRNPYNSRGQRKDIGPCFGGNFLFSCDSRFSLIVSNQPIAIHDRWDTQEDYDILSR